MKLPIADPVCRGALRRSDVTAKSYVDLSDVLWFIRHVGVLSAQCLQTVRRTCL
jgi:hypothetical protein